MITIPTLIYSISKFKKYLNFNDNFLNILHKKYFIIGSFLKTYWIRQIWLHSENQPHHEG